MKSERCPACGVAANYNPYTDWFEHADGSTATQCVVRIMRGEVELQERPDLIAKWPPPSPSPTELYRFFDNDGALLYIGISLSAVHRASEHRQDKPWWPDVVTMTVERHATRGQALMAERHAIMAERPLHNVAHNRSRPERRHAQPAVADQDVDHGNEAWWCR